MNHPIGLENIPEPYAEQIRERGRVKCLSVQQPWATIIAKEAKDVEMRTWSTPHRGPLVICAGKTPRGDGVPGYMYESREAVIYHGPAVWSAPRGVAIALVDLYDCRKMEPREYRRALSDYEPGNEFIGWFVRVIQLLPPIPIKGSLGLFEIGLDHPLFAAQQLLG